MFIAEALIVRKELKTRIADLRARLDAVLVVQEGDTPVEDPLALLARLDETLEEYRQLVIRLHLSNLTSTLPDGRSLTQAVVERELLDEQMALLRRVAQEALKPNDRYAYSELRRVPTVDVAALRKEVDRLARQRRELDTALQRANWQHELTPLPA